MFERIHLNSLEDYFTSYAERTEKGVYFGRLTVYNEDIATAINRYIEETFQSGICISSKIGNPDEKHLDYYEEIMEMTYRLDVQFFQNELEKWVPRISEEKRTVIAAGFYNILQKLEQKGKNEDMQRNAYIKYMCWLYYKFERLLTQNPNSVKVPKILFEGYPKESELLFLSVLSKAGCDILLLLYEGDESYLKIDKDSVHSEFIESNGNRFPSDYSILNIREQMIKRKTTPKLPKISTEKIVNTNTWIQGEIYQDVLCELKDRGREERFFYNVFAGIYGVEDTASYYSELLKWKLKLESTTEIFVIEEIPKPDYDEINAIQRTIYETPLQLISDMVKQISCSDKKAEAYGKAAFLKGIEREKELPMPKLLNKAVKLVSLLNRYLGKFFGNADENHKEKKLLIYYGEINSKTELLLLEMMSNLPMDILHINPEGNTGLEIKAELFFAKKYPNTLKREKFPVNIEDVQFGTVAYQAEQEINSLMYQDTGMYRNQQFTKAVPVIIQNTYEEIKILWNQEAKYRPNFEVFEGKVIVPVIFSKVSGVPGTVSEYWEGISKLVSEDVFLIKEFPYLGTEQNPLKEKAYKFFSEGKLQIEKLKSHPEYPFSFIRESMQDYMFEKLQELIDSKIMEGTGTDGTENLILATILNMDKRILRLIQKYDFTRMVPKVMVIHTRESNCSKEDSILLAYLSKIGFDIVLYVPTGYTSIERFYTKQLFIEHQVGEYKYDLRVPKLETKHSTESLMDRILRRGKK